MVKEMWKEFKEFAIKGNVLDLAIGVLIGTTFNKIVTSLVNDVVMPIFGIVIGGVNFQDLSITYHNAEIKYGSFIQSIIDFLIIGFSLFFVVKVLNRLRTLREKQVEKEEKSEPKLTKEQELLMEIRDLLKERAETEKSN